ncbi:MAG: hypothetical protein HUK40_21685 [Desulfobacter sp.]|nr:hypothetical protein [Desulfobacter sp.]WDP86007.1 MAG: hypothetical protein HUN05_13425 [Desulfobacter sp.]
MGHEDRGHYARKHPGLQIDPAIAQEIKAAAKQGQLFCASAHRLAKVLGQTPAQIGIQTDLMELCIAHCQLGLFGYFPDKKKINPKVNVSKALELTIFNTQKNSRLSCRQCWDIAKAHGISKLAMGSACEKLDIRIKPCQLGAF